MVDHREAVFTDHSVHRSQFTVFKYYLFISEFWQERWSSKSIIALMAISFIQYPLMISPENVNLDKTKSKISSILSISFNMFHFILH